MEERIERLLIKQGAESLTYKTLFLPGITCLLKVRLAKPYRHPVLDERLRKHRIYVEARLLYKCYKGGISCPVLYFVDVKKGELWTEWIEGRTLKDELLHWENNAKSCEDFKLIMESVGHNIGKMHQLSIVHGDLTTSNIMIRSPTYQQLPLSLVELTQDKKIVIIDFGLGSVTHMAEDMAVDLYLKYVLEGYSTSWKDAKSVLRRLEEVRLRGRKRNIIMQGKIRLVKWFATLSLKEKSRILKDVSQIVLQRRSKTCNFLEYKDEKICYRRYASLFFILGIEQTDNELITLEIIHRYVEALDRYFGNVCELDIIFNFPKAYFILDELIMAGEMQESSRKAILKTISQQDTQEDIEKAEDTLGILNVGMRLQAGTGMYLQMKYVGFAEFHLMDVVQTQGACKDVTKDYSYSSSLPDGSNSPLRSTSIVDEMFMFSSAHNKSVSSEEFTCNNTAKSKEYHRKKQQVFERLNTVMPGPLGLRNHSNTMDTKYMESGRSKGDLFSQAGTQNKSPRMFARRSPSCRYINGALNHSMHEFNTSPTKENYTKKISQEIGQGNVNIGHEQGILSPTYQNNGKASTLKDRSNLREYTNDKNHQILEKSKKGKNDKSNHHLSHGLKKESKFPDENSEKHLLEWARRDKELSSKFIEKAPNPVISIQEHISKNTYPRMLNDKKLSNSSRYGYFFERDSNSTTFSTTFSTSSNISRDEKISMFSISSPNSDLSISDALLGDHRNVSKSDLHTESFDKVLNNMEDSFYTFNTRSDDTLAFQNKNSHQKNSINDKHNSNFRCKRCNKPIEGKSIRCSDGKISGRFHRECFKCFELNCQKVFTSSEVYVFEGEPFCAKHYHILNNSLCVACGEGIEGKCFQTETDEKYHFYCFKCNSCKKQLNEEYFDIDVNVLSRKHQRIVFSSQAIRHVAEQIDKLYKPKQIPLHQMQLSLANIEELPSVWPSADEASHERYLSNRARLMSLAAALENLRQKYSFYESIYNLLQQTAKNKDDIAQVLATLGETRRLAAKIRNKLEQENIYNGVYKGICIREKTNAMENKEKTIQSIEMFFEEMMKENLDEPSHRLQ
ncbi:hypothetical protein PMAC_001851 [Pneumocystis sp. 'macacae']|nr:hypothetical protein PMAC_001851 [Pneumocystis sp. 'macacae']